VRNFKPPTWAKDAPEGLASPPPQGAPIQVQVSTVKSPTHAQQQQSASASGAGSSTAAAAKPTAAKK